MKTAWCLGLCLSASLCWAALRPVNAWTADLEAALARSPTVVLLVAAADRPLSAATRRAVDEAWIELRPRAERVFLERSPDRLERPSALAVCVFGPAGLLVARRDGPLDASQAEEWLRAALASTSSADPCGTGKCSEPRHLFERAQRDLRLGVLERAQREFTQLASDCGREWELVAHERLARIALEFGNVARAREECELASGPHSDALQAARWLSTRGSIELAERKNRAATETLAQALDALEQARDPEADLVRLEWARARAATGEESAAIATLDELVRTASSNSTRDSARRLASALRSPPLSH